LAKENFNSNFETVRERIMKLLQEVENPLTVEEIAAYLGLPPRSTREIYDHLWHIARTINRTSRGRKKLLMIPPQCRKCGYVFKNLNKPRKPSKCPKCKSTWIMPPAFIIK